MRRVSFNGRYRAATSVRKGAIAAVLAAVPAIAGIFSVALATPDVAASLRDAWPGAVGLLCVAVLTGALNWLKNRGR